MKQHHQHSPIKILNQREKTEIEEQLNQQFGIKKIKGILLKKGEEKIFLFQGEFTKIQIKNIEQTIPIERIGIYFAKQDREHIRLSFDSIQLLKQQITKNIFEINKEQTEKWLLGQELNIPTDKRGFIIIKSQEDFLGTGKASENKITNFVPKNRRLKNKED